MEDKRKELMQELERIENQIFIIDMMDRWDKNIAEVFERLVEEKNNINKQLDIIKRKEEILNGKTNNN